MIRRFLKHVAVLSVAIILLPHVALAAPKIADNDVNKDGYVDTLHVKPDRTPQCNDKMYNGYRVVGITVASIDPYWNGQDTGIERVRVLPYVDGAREALEASGNTVVGIDPYEVFSAFYVLDSGGEIFDVEPTDDGLISGIEWAKALIDLTSVLSNGSPIYSILADFFFSFYNYAGSNSVSSDYAYNWSYVYPADIQSLPYSVAACSAHTSAYKNVGVNHEYEYRDKTWALASRHPIQAAGQVKYQWFDYTDVYYYTSPIVYQGYYAYGFGDS